jgi:hypothetical protein
MQRRAIQAMGGARASDPMLSNPRAEVKPIDRSLVLVLAPSRSTSGDRRARGVEGYTSAGS